MGLRKGQTNSGSFKKGHVPWNKGKKIDKNKYPKWGMTGKKLSEEAKKKLSIVAKKDKVRIERLIMEGKRAREKRTKKIPSKILNEDLAYILGVMIGDGTVDGNSTMLWTIDKDFALTFKRVLERWSGYKCKLYKDIRPKYKQGFCWVVRLYSKRIRNFLKNFDITKILTSQKDIQASFLRGFYDSEGGFCPINRVVRCYNTDINKINLIKELLTKLGISFGKIIVKKSNNNRKEQYIIPIYKEKTINFLNKIGFSIQRKQQPIENYVNMLQNGK